MNLIETLTNIDSNNKIWSHRVLINSSLLLSMVYMKWRNSVVRVIWDLFWNKLQTYNCSLEIEMNCDEINVMDEWLILV